jgi:hypothetical protein
VIAEQRVTHLEQLRSALGSYGLEARLIRSPHGGPEFLRVRNPRAAGLAENVTCAPAPDGRADYYWWSWGERLHGTDDPGVAAGKVAHVLGPILNSVRE